MFNCFSMKQASAFERTVFAKIIAVDSFGAMVQYTGGVKALCPLNHMSEFEIASPRE